MGAPFGRYRLMWVLSLAAAGVCVGLTACVSPASAEDAVGADFILRHAGVRAGAAVHLGSGDGSLVCALAGSGRFVVHGLDVDASNVKQARKRLSALGLYGPASVERIKGDGLPYADNTINLIVIDNAPRWLKRTKLLRDIRRVLCPQGVAILGSRDASMSGQAPKSTLASVGLSPSSIVTEGGAWAVYRKPRLEGADVWTHQYHGPDGHAVSMDSRVGMPTGFRWIAGPHWPHGGRKSAVSGRVSAGGRLFYGVEDEIRGVGRRPVRRQSLVARDAFNGLLLWKRPTSKGAQVVSDGRRVYGPEASKGPLVEIDAATGKKMYTFSGTELARRFFLASGKLFVQTDALLCIDTETRKVLWTHRGHLRDPVFGNGRVFGLRGRGKSQKTVCVDAGSGEERWSVPTAKWSKQEMSVVCFHREDRLFLGGRGLHALDAATGKHLWSYPYPLMGHGGHYLNCFQIDGLVWVHRSGKGWVGLDPNGGKEKRILSHPSITHRCSRDVAAATGMIFFGTLHAMDVRNKRLVSGRGKYSGFSPARNGCGAGGAMPANGLLYAFPHGCHCGAWTRGILALTSEDPFAAEGDVSHALEKGPDYDRFALAPKDRIGARTSAWPTFRFNSTRSGATPCASPGIGRIRWTADGLVPSSALDIDPQELRQCPPLTAPVVADGLVVVAVVEQHRVTALDTATGKVRWSFFAGGRVVASPTIHRGLCIFGAQDGWVYALAAGDGRLVWRFRAAPKDRRIWVRRQLESVWPLPGGVLVHDGLAYVCAGRHGGSDGGLWLHALDPGTGRAVWSRNARGLNTAPDVMSVDAGRVYLRRFRFNAKSGETVRRGRRTRVLGGSLGFLDASWYRRSLALRKGRHYWSVSGVKAQQLVFDSKRVYGYGLGSAKAPAEHPPRVFARGPQRKSPPLIWTFRMPATGEVRAMAVAGSRLLVSGRTDRADPGSGMLWELSAEEGKVIRTQPLKCAPAYLGLAATSDGIYLTTNEGRLLCIGGPRELTLRDASRP